MKNNLSIFNKYINSTYKSIPFNLRKGEAGKIQYFPPVSKEWKNNIYVFNSNQLKNLPVYDLNINQLITNYFNLYFNYIFMISRFKFHKGNRSCLNNKIFVSKAEIKHTNNKAIITIYTYNREKLVLLDRIRELEKYLQKKILFIFYKTNILYKDITNKLRNEIIKNLLFEELILFRKLKLKLNLNKYKYEEIFLFKLSKLITKFYNKKVEFNIINLKSIVFNSDIFTKLVTFQVYKKKSYSPLFFIKFILNRVILPKVNKLVEKSSLIRKVNLDLIENKYKDFHIKSIIQTKNFDEKFNEIYSSYILNKDYNEIYEIIFNSIKYKNMNGVKLEAKGRLTRRYRADRAVFNVKSKGGLKNLDSSYKGLSSVMLRGYVSPNIEYSIFTSKRRIGAFAIKGWVAGK